MYISLQFQSKKSDQSKQSRSLIGHWSSTLQGVCVGAWYERLEEGKISFKHWLKSTSRQSNCIQVEWRKHQIITVNKCIYLNKKYLTDFFSFPSKIKRTQKNGEMRNVHLSIDTLEISKCHHFFFDTYSIYCTIQNYRSFFLIFRIYFYYYDFKILIETLSLLLLFFFRFPFLSIIKKTSHLHHHVRYI